MSLQLTLLVVVVSCAAFVESSGQVAFLSNTGGAKFSGNSPIDADILPHVLLTALGITTPELEGSWDGLSVNPFTLPQDLILVLVGGVSGLTLEGNHYDVTGSINAARIYSNTVHQMKHLNVNKKRIRLEPKEGTTIHSNQLSSLSAELEQDRAFLLELEELERQAAKSTFLSGDRDAVMIHLTSLVGLVSEYGDDSPQVKEATQLLEKELNRLHASAGDKTLVAVVTHKHNSKRTRTLLSTDDQPHTVAESEKDSLNIAGSYNDNYAPIFNIILWLFLILTVALIVIADVTANMDPGKDSIIYRMTNPRLKKDA